MATAPPGQNAADIALYMPGMTALISVCPFSVQWTYVARHLPSIPMVTRDCIQNSSASRHFGNRWPACLYNIWLTVFTLNRCQQLRHARVKNINGHWLGNHCMLPIEPCVALSTRKHLRVGRG